MSGRIRVLLADDHPIMTEGLKLTIEVYLTPEALRLHIADNGCFRGTLEKGFGLTTMEENVRASGGTLAFEAEAGRGFGIAAEWRPAQ